jgi:hypothetical protein
MVRSREIRSSALPLKPLVRTRYRAPQRWQQRQHNTDPSNSFNVRARRPQDGQRKKLHEPPFANFTRSRTTSTPAIVVRAMSASISPLARSIPEPDKEGPGMGG